VYRGSPGILDLPGRACGRMESWHKWSLPFSPLRQDSDELASWRPVRKRRRITRFSPASGPIVARGPGLDQQPRCEVKLTEVRMRGQDWWTLGLEATGPADLLRGALQATAALVFAQALPGTVEPGPDESSSYAEWLCQQPGAESCAGSKASDDRVRTGAANSGTGTGPGMEWIWGLCPASGMTPVFPEPTHAGISGDPHLPF
jgi:hypothetical protein